MKPHTYRYRVMESDLPASARLVAHVLATRANFETGHVKVTVRRLAAWCGLNKDTVVSALRVLDAAGWVVVLGQKHERASREYRLSVPTSRTNTGVDNGGDATPEGSWSVPVVRTDCPSESDTPVPVVRTPIPLEEIPACTDAPQPPAARVADTDSRDAIVYPLAARLANWNR